MPAITEAVETHGGMEFVVISDAFPRNAPPFMQKVPWRKETEAAEVAAFDIGLMPLPDNPWTRGKCGFKLLLYAACGVPAVASPVGVNSEIVSDGETGILASSPEQWTQALLALGRDAGLRNDMGKAGRARAEAVYSTRIVIAEWARILKAAAEGRPAQRRNP